MILLFGVAFEFPLILLMLNFTGVVQRQTAAQLVAGGDLPVLRVRRDRHAGPRPVRDDAAGGLRCRCCTSSRSASPS